MNELLDGSKNLKQDSKMLANSSYILFVYKFIIIQKIVLQISICFCAIAKNTFNRTVS